WGGGGGGGRRGARGLGRGWRAPPGRRGEPGVPPAAEGPVDDRFLEDDAARAPRLDRRGRDVEPAYERRARRRHDRRAQHSDGRRFPGSVRAQQTEHLTGPDLEVDALYRLDSAGVRLL